MGSSACSCGVTKAPCMRGVLAALGSLGCANVLSTKYGNAAGGRPRGYYISVFSKRATCLCESIFSGGASACALESDL